ncbi:Oxo-4-hydroxy-4-carboxy-5-ureidoimidazoline decarboxylase [Jackrogersella minutella]|nr:Oxo-4-hydroxy-4-carboxy-5-ureidoimidazoline decarboxylase [Jackrogersella minutella]
MMPPTTLPPISSLPTVDDTTLKSVLDALFEPSADLHALILPSIRDGPSASYASLIEHVGIFMSQLANSSRNPDAVEKLHGILGSHPRLGEKKVESAQSRAEQAHLNTSPDSREREDEAAKLKSLNEEYEARFPGLRYVVFVNGRSRAVVMQNMRERIDRGDIQAEEREAIQAMVDIALDRSKKLQGIV